MHKPFIAGIAAVGAAGASWMPIVSAQSASDVNQNPSFDTKGSGAHMRIQAPAMTEPVATYSKTEIDAKLDAAAARGEAGRAGLDGKLDRVLDAIKDIRGDFSELKTQVHDDSKATTYSIWGLAVAMIAIILGLIGFLIANQGTMTTANGNLIAALKGDSPPPAAAPQTAPSK